MSASDFKPRTVVITEIEPGSYSVVRDNQVADRLDSGEALWCVTHFFTKQPGAMPYGRNIESYWDMERRIREEIESKRRPCDRLLSL